MNMHVVQQDSSSSLTTLTASNSISLQLSESPNLRVINNIIVSSYSSLQIASLQVRLPTVTPLGQFARLPFDSENLRVTQVLFITKVTNIILPLSSRGTL